MFKMTSKVKPTSLISVRVMGHVLQTLQGQAMLTCGFLHTSSTASFFCFRQFFLFPSARISVWPL